MDRGRWDEPLDSKESSDDDEWDNMVEGGTVSRPPPPLPSLPLNPLLLPPPSPSLPLSPPEENVHAVCVREKAPFPHSGAFKGFLE